MAEAFARLYGHGQVEALSAGTEPKGLHPVAVEVTRERGIDISRRRAKAFSQGLARGVDYVVTVCGEARDYYPLLPPGITRIHWPLSDPARTVGSPEQILESFRPTRDQVKELVRAFVSGFSDPAVSSP